MSPLMRAAAAACPLGQRLLGGRGGGKVLCVGSGARGDMAPRGAAGCGYLAAMRRSAASITVERSLRSRS
jgi:hypothetical protein